MKTEPKPKLHVTRNYDLFRYAEGNRTLQPKKHRALFRSMQEYGFLFSFPIVVRRGEDGHLYIRDGQHRLHFARELGLSVYYIEDDKPWNVAKINSTPEKWTPRDHAERHAAEGLTDYQTLLEFADRYSISIMTAVGLLSGLSSSVATSSNGPHLARFHDGSWTVGDLGFAHAVARCYVGLAMLSKQVRNARLISALSAVVRIWEFEPERLLSGAERCRNKLIAYSTVDAYLDMLEEIYNFGRKRLVSIKVPAQAIARDRNVATRTSQS